MASIQRSTPSPRAMLVINRLVTFLVDRGRGPVAKRLMVIHWTGRKTGKQYSTPVSRLELDGQLFTKTRASYQHNFVGGGPAEIVLDGERRSFIGTTVDSPEVVATRMRAVLDQLGPKQGARSLGLKIDGDPTTDELAAFATGEAMVVIDFVAV